MDQLIYSINIGKATIQLITNNLGYCVCIINGVHTHIFINASIDESLSMMQHLMDQII